MAEKDRKIIEDILFSIKRDDLPKGASIPRFLKPGVDKDKIFNKAIKRYAPGAKMKDIIFAYDYNATKNGKGGILFTTEGFAADRIREDRSARSLSMPIRYVDLTHISRSGDYNFTLHFRDGQRVTVYPGIFGDYIRVAVNRIVEALTGEPIPEPEAASGKEPELTPEEAFSKGVSFYFGEDVAEDKAQAAYWYAKAAERGHAKAAYNLALMYEKGEGGLPQDDEKYMALMEQSARAGFAKAQNNLAFAYDLGKYGAAVDKEKAIHWYRQAVAQGHMHAQFNLGLSYEDGDGVPQDRDKALELFRLAAEQGHEKAQKKVAEYETRAAEEAAPEPEPTPEEAFDKALGFYRGKDGNEDKAQAARWFAKAAEQGHGEAACYLAKMYAGGEGGLPQDEAQYMALMEQSARAGFAEAQNSLALAYDLGRHGAAIDKEKAIHWYQKAADQGYKFAQYNLGLSYQEGDGVSRDRGKALELFRLAAAQGHEKALKKVAEYEAEEAEETKPEPVREPAPKPKKAPAKKKPAPAPAPAPVPEPEPAPAPTPAPKPKKAPAKKKPAPAPREITPAARTYSHQKPMVKVAVFGHWDSGKTCLLSALSRYFAWRYPAYGNQYLTREEILKRQALVTTGPWKDANILHEPFCLLLEDDDCLYTFIEIPSDPTYVINAQRGMYASDVGVYVFSTYDGPIGEHRCLSSAIAAGIGRFAAYQSFCSSDTDPELIDLAQFPLIGLFESLGSESGDIICGDSTDEADPRCSLNLLVELVRKAGGFHENDGPLVMAVKKVFRAENGDPIAAGVVTGGMVQVGDPVHVYGYSDEPVLATCEEIRVFDMASDKAMNGELAALRLSGIPGNLLRAGQTIAKPGSMTLADRVVFDADLLTKDEGGRHTPFFHGYRPHLILGHADVTVTVSFPTGLGMICPGDHVTLWLELDRPLPVALGSLGSRGVLCDNGKLVATGRVTGILDRDR